MAKRGGVDVEGVVAGGGSFALTSEGIDLGCGAVIGFDEGELASRDRTAAPPRRLVIVSPTPVAAAWLDAWAEDVAAYRRTVIVRRLADSTAIVVVATLAAHGYGVPTSLAIESVRRFGAARELFRSGVHAKVDVATFLASTEAEPWFPFETCGEFAAGVFRCYVRLGFGRERELQEFSC